MDQAVSGCFEGDPWPDRDVVANGNGCVCSEADLRVDEHSTADTDISGATEWPQRNRTPDRRSRMDDHSRPRINDGPDAV